MDPYSVQATPSTEEDEWDTDGFVIPSLTVIDSDLIDPPVPKVKDQKPSPSQVVKEEEKIYLGPHGAPPQSKQQELNAGARKQRLKHKLKDADRKFTGTGRENKVESLRELVGGKASAAMSKGSPRDWLDPHCNESQFERSAH
eukprot:TRINITY_DN50319_c0_g1_i1.p1 TRINITY_DN50319_c0_g1~~TRINITY_DN50319_c0_g1_i1.p1  ORF type:complete len:143 (-),score=39.43 TRINITY_DN50319_c0_g1_i1:470-898(-)